MTKKFIFILLILIFVSCNKSNNIEYFKNSNNDEIKVPIIEKSIGNKKVLFIVDSGANLSVIDSTWYYNNSNLFCESEDIYITLVGISGITKIKSNLVYTVIDSGYVFFSTSNLDVVIKNLKPQGFTVVGILGSDYLKENNLSIDYYKQAVYSAIK